MVQDLRAAAGPGLTSVSAPLRVAIADDSALFRAGLVELLRDPGVGVEVVAAVADGAALLDAVRRLEPDIALLDIRMPPTYTDEGIHVARQVRDSAPGTGILLLSHHVEATYALRVLVDAVGGVGYLLKDRVADVDDLVAAMQRVAAGQSVVDPLVVSALLAHNPLAALTDRERDVLALMAEGRSNTAIASALFCSVKTVETHVNRIFTKLDLPPAPDDHRRVLAVLSFLRG